MAFKKSYKKVFKKKHKSEFKKKVKNIVKTVINKDRENKWYIRGAGTIVGGNRVDLTGSLGSNFEVSGLIRKYVQNTSSTIDLPNWFRQSNKIRLIGIKYALRVRADQTATAEGYNNVRVVIASTKTLDNSSGSVFFDYLTEDYLGDVNSQVSLTAGDLTAYPLDMKTLDHVYMDKHFFSCTTYNGNGLTGADYLDKNPYKKGYVKINKILSYKDVTNATAYVGAENCRIYVAACSDSSATPHPILEGHYKIIFEDMN